MESSRVKLRPEEVEEMSAPTYLPLQLSSSRQTGELNRLLKIRLKQRQKLEIRNGIENGNFVRRLNRTELNWTPLSSMRRNRKQIHARKKRSAKPRADKKTLVVGLSATTATTTTTFELPFRARRKEIPPSQMLTRFCGFFDCCCSKQMDG